MAQNTLVLRYLRLILGYGPWHLNFQVFIYKNQFWSFHQKISKFFILLIEVNFSVFAPGPRFFRFYLQIFKFLIFHQKFLDISKYTLFFWPLGPYFLGFYMKNFTFLFFTKLAQSTYILRNLRLNLGFWPPAPYFQVFQNQDVSPKWLKILFF